MRRTFRLLGLEAAFSFAYESWISPVYWSSLAGTLGLGVGWVSFLSMVPWLGQVGQLLGLWFLRRVKSVRRYTLVVAGIARVVWCLPLGVGIYWGLQTAPFPVKKWFTLVALTSLVSSLFSASSAVAWMSWTKILIPETVRARFFGYRHRYVMAALVSGNLLAAYLSTWQSEGQRYGLVVLGCLGILSAGLSTLLLTFVPEVLSLKLKKQEIAQDVESFFAPLRDRRFLKILVYGAAMNGGIQFAGPYFPYHFTKNLGISMGTVIGWGVITHLGCFLAAPFWARRIDRFAQGPKIVLITSILIALSPLFYVTPSVSFIQWIAPFDYLTNGMAWVGYFLATQSLVFESAPRQSSVAYFSWYAAILGLTGSVMAFCGGIVGDFLSPWGGLRILFGVATVLRLLLIGLLYGICIQKNQTSG